MNTLPPEVSPPMPQGQRWFRWWIGGLITFFVLATVVFAWMQGSQRRHERASATTLMDPAAPDPGVTAGEGGSTAEAVPVEVGVYVERIPELSVKDATWTVVFDLWFRWKSDHLKPADNFVVMEGSIESRDKLAEHHADGVHYERYRVVAKITKQFLVTRFPLDEHLLTLAIENGELVREKMVFVPDLASSSVSSRVKVPGYRLAAWKAIEKPHSYKTTRGDPRLAVGTKSTYSQFRVGIPIKRDGWGLYFKMFQALYIAVVIAFLACFIRPTNVDPRFGLGVGGLFAAVANAYLVSGFVPDTGEIALADFVNMLGILTILISLIESTVSLYVYEHCEKPELSRRLDRVSFIVMLGGFILANAALALAAAV